MSTKYIIRTSLIQSIKEKTLATSQKFFKEKIRFYGVKVPTVNKIGAESFKQMGSRSKSEIIKNIKCFFSIMKRGILVIVLILSFGIYASASNFYLAIKLKENPSQFFLLDEHPNVFFDENLMHVVTSKQDVEFDIANVLEFYFSYPTGINFPVIIENEIVISFPDKDNVKINNLGSDSIIQLYTINGISVKCETSTTDSKILMLSLKNLPKGVYLLSINGNQSFKFIRK